MRTDVWPIPNRLGSGFVPSPGSKRWNYIVEACVYLGIQPKRIVEIGTNKGHCADALARNFPDAKIFTIDPFVANQWYIENGHAPGHMRRHPTQEYFNKQYERAKRNLSKRDNAKLLRMTSVEASGKLTNPPDVVFIDGDHSYEATRTDIAAWITRLSPGGLLAGHDFNFIDHVRDAVTDFFGDGNFHVQDGADDCWGYSAQV